jgi:hypothetical protein
MLALRLPRAWMSATTRRSPRIVPTVPGRWCRPDVADAPWVHTHCRTSAQQIDHLKRQVDGRGEPASGKRPHLRNR